jgi:hypothetical protein
MTGALCRAAVLGALVATGSIHAAESESLAPQLVFYFEVDGKRVPLELDKPFATQALGGAKAATLRLAPHREFSHGGIRFRFPREFGFEADLEWPQISMWTLSGNDCSILVHRYRAQSDPKAIQQSVVEQMAALYKSAKKKTVPVSLEVGGAVLRGTRIDVEMAGTKIFQDIYALPSGKDVLVLIVQDAPSEGGRLSAERVGVETLLRESLKLPK